MAFGFVPPILLRPLKVKPLIQRRSNCFQALNLPVRYQLDRQQLEQNYRELQKKAHPDLKNLKDQSNSTIEAESEHLSACVRTLRDPVLRAKHYLLLKKVFNEADFSDEGSTGTTRIKNTALMMELMELHEDLEEAAEKGDWGAIEDMDKKNEKIIEELEGELRDKVKMISDSDSSGADSQTDNINLKQSLRGTLDKCSLYLRLKDNIWKELEKKYSIWMFDCWLRQR